ncbi:hypothetical protein N7475_008253 [Penicillium sp. IBT 31633x]|nr:hypothetical protein N7475_008253 [Penicillium sp. IBT 31633x]
MFGSYLAFATEIFPDARFQSTIIWALAQKANTKMQMTIDVCHQAPLMVVMVFMLMVEEEMAMG